MVTAYNYNMCKYSMWERHIWVIVLYNDQGLYLDPFHELVYVLTSGVYTVEPLFDFNWCFLSSGLLFFYHFVPLHFLALVSKGNKSSSPLKNILFLLADIN
jgi:hypothetical protein